MCACVSVQIYERYDMKIIYTVILPRTGQKIMFKVTSDSDPSWKTMKVSHAGKATGRKNIMNVCVKGERLLCL